MIAFIKKKPGGFRRGMSSAVLLSILIHATLFFLAGILVVFTVVMKREVEFEPPQAVERPKMKLKKPKVKVKKTSRPRSTTRIVTKINRASMPDIQLPEMAGIGDGLGDGGVGGFDMMPDLDDVTIFGSGQSIGNDFEGVFYDCKRDQTGRPIPVDHDRFKEAVDDMVRNGMDPSGFSRYYRSPKKLYTTSFMVPQIRSLLGPQSFGEDTGGWCWMVHYRGQLVYPEDITFRFWGYADDFMVVSLSGKVVIDASHLVHSAVIAGHWHSTSADSWKYHMGNGYAIVGDWITLKAGVPIEMDLVIGEDPGGIFCAMLCVEVEGVEYERNRQGGPILPMFKTAEPSRGFLDIIVRDLIPGEAAVTNGPVFRDYILSPKTNRVEDDVDSSETNVEAALEKSVWTSADGKEIEAGYVNVIADKVVLKTAQGRLLQVPLAELSPVDREYVELMNPPEFAIDFVKLSSSKLSRYELSPHEQLYGYPPPRVNDFTFGAKVKQRRAKKYNHELKVEYFAIAKELLGDKYVLLDRKSSTFTPTQQNELSHSFKGEPIEFVEYDLEGQTRGIRPDGNLVVLTDERGQIIQHKASKSWLWENIENLKRLPVGAYMDRTCSRTYPTSPKPTSW